MMSAGRSAKEGNGGRDESTVEENEEMDRF